MAENTITLTLGGSVELRLVQGPPAPAITTIVTTRYGGFSVTAKGNTMAYTLPDDHKVQVQVAYVDSEGHPAAVQEPVSWTSSDETIAVVTADATDSKIATIEPVGPNIGNVQITVSADADLGAGVTTLSTLLDVTVVAGQAVSGTIAPVGPAQPV